MMLRSQKEVARLGKANLTGLLEVVMNKLTSLESSLNLWSTFKKLR